MERTIDISIVSPVYRAEKMLDKLVFEIQKAVESLNLSYEIILVDDRSPDGSWDKMKSISKSVKEVKSVRLSRNFGQHPAIMAGLSRTKGKWVVVMDCDLQDQPKEIIKLYNKAQEGFDVVLARRENRQDGLLKKASSKLFSIFYSFFTDTEYDNEVANFGIYNEKVIRSILEIKDYIKFFPLFVKFVAFNQTSISVEHAERDSGSSSYNLYKLLSLAFNSIISFSNKPLKLFVKFGILMSVIAFMVGVYYFYLYFSNKIEVEGFTSLMISIWFLSGVLLTSVGITGIYVGKIFDQTKSRPVFIIDEVV